jgi:hypothetical protein
MARSREVSMRSIVTTAGLLAAALFTVAGSAQASTIDVKVPFPSVVLIRSEKDKAATTVVLTSPAIGHDPAGDKPALTFTRVQNQYRLHDIWNSGTQGVEITNR